jgi:hypothetical protein
VSRSNKFSAENRKTCRKISDYKDGLAFASDASPVGTTLTTSNGLTLGRLSKAYVSLAFMRERDDHSRAATLAWCGAYEVRLVEFTQSEPAGECLFWLELYCHVTKTSLDSYRCDNLDDAEAAVDHLISCAKQLHDKSE